MFGDKFQRLRHSKPTIERDCRVRRSWMILCYSLIEHHACWLSLCLSSGDGRSRQALQTTFENRKQTPSQRQIEDDFRSKDTEVLSHGRRCFRPFISCDVEDSNEIRVRPSMNAARIPPRWLHNLEAKQCTTRVLSINYMQAMENQQAADLKVSDCTKSVWCGLCCLQESTFMKEEIL